MTNRRDIKTCYIAAPAGTNLSPLSDALRSRGINVVAPASLSSGVDLNGGVKETISTADLVIGVLTNERRSQWVLFELGQAIALGKQALLLVPRRLSSLLPDLAGVLTIRANPSNSDAIEFALDQILASPQPKAVRPTVPSMSRPLGAEADFLLQSYQNELASGGYRVAEQLVADALRRSGLNLVVESETQGRRVDIAVWSDALQPYVGNPLLIEVKHRLRSSSELQAAARQLALQVVASGSLWGLLLYGQGPEIEMRSSGDPRVLVMSISELLNNMRARSFEEIIRDQRNARVHGGPS
jgi:hypothetical protein